MTFRSIIQSSFDEKFGPFVGTVPVNNIFETQKQKSSKLLFRALNLLQKKEKIFSKDFDTELNYASTSTFLIIPYQTTPKNYTYTHRP